MTDMGLTVFYFFSIYAIKKFFDAPSASRVVITGIMCGLTFMSKISGLILIPIVSCLFLIYYQTRSANVAIPELSTRFQKAVCIVSLFLTANALGEKQAMVLFGPFLLLALFLMGREIPWIAASRPLRILFRALIAGGALLCMIYSWRLKKKYGVSIASVLLAWTLAFATFSIFFSRWSACVPKCRVMKYFLSVCVIAMLVIVLGYTDISYKFYRFIGFGNFMKPLGIVLSHSARGHGSCVEGSFITCDWRYFFELLAIKTPLLMLFLWGFGTILFLRSRQSVLTKAILFIPITFFLIAASANKIKIGLRPNLFF